MIRWQTVVARRFVALLAVVSLAGCWAEDELIHGGFTAAQWAHLQDEFEPPARKAPCGNVPNGANNIPIASCDAAARLGQMLFFEPKLSGPGQTSCATCHDAVPDKDTGWFIDTRPSNAVSQGAVTTTRHNTITLVNVHVGERDFYTWTGECDQQRSREGREAEPEM